MLAGLTVEPAELVAVTLQVSVLPLSAFTGWYVELVAPEIAVGALPVPCRYHR